MRSNLLYIYRGGEDLAKILAETERVAAYNLLGKRETLSLRLLAEELVSLLPAVVRDFEGSFWVKSEGTSYELHFELFVDGMDFTTREELIKVSTSRRNAAAVGITGKLLAAFDYLVLGGEASEMLSPSGRYGLTASPDYAQAWALSHYREALPEGDAEKWDELEKSILAKVADDVVVGIRGTKVSIIIYKKF